MKKTWILMLAVLCILLQGCSSKKEEYPQIAYIRNVSYYNTQTVCEAVPRKMPDGVVETFVPQEIMPDAPESANFGQEYGSMEYMFLDDGQLIMHLGDNWYYFVQK